MERSGRVTGHNPPPPTTGNATAEAELSAARAALEEAREALESILQKAEGGVQEATGTPEVEMPS